jgi:hypothetical protein
MKKAMLLRLAILLSFVGIVIACDFACEVEKTIATGLAPGMATILGCPATAVPVLQATVQSDINLGNLCAVAEHCKKQNLKRGTIAMAVCPIVSATVTGYLGNAIPPTWIAAGCQPAAGGLGVVVMSACNLLPF